MWRVFLQKRRVALTRGLTSQVTSMGNACCAAERGAQRGGVDIENKPWKSFVANEVDDGSDTWQRRGDAVV